MGAQCRCGTDVQFSFNHLGCIACGAACCPACSYELESASYCTACAETLLEMPWAAQADPFRHPSPPARARQGVGAIAPREAS